MKSKWDPDFVEIARSLARKGATDEDLAKRFGINVRTVDKWKVKYGQFGQAIKEGRDRSLPEVENALYRSATGFEYDEEAVTKDGDVVTVRKYSKPNITAQIFILCNRERRHWQNVQRHEHGGATGKEGEVSPIKIVLYEVPDHLKGGSK